MKQISVRVDNELLAAVERTRGDVPRERWLRSVLKRETERAASNARALIAGEAITAGEEVRVDRGGRAVPAIPSDPATFLRATRPGVELVTDPTCGVLGHKVNCGCARCATIKARR